MLSSQSEDYSPSARTVCKDARDPLYWPLLCFVTIAWNTNEGCESCLLKFHSNGSCRKPEVLEEQCPSSLWLWDPYP